MSANVELFDPLDSSVKEDVILANGKKTRSTGKSVCEVRCAVPEETSRSITLHDVLLVPELETNLFSVRAATKRGATVVFDDTRSKILKGDHVAAVSSVSDGLYHLDIVHQALLPANQMVHGTKCVHEWH